MRLSLFDNYYQIIHSLQFLMNKFWKILDLHQNSTSKVFWNCPSIACMKNHGVCTKPDTCWDISKNVTPFCHFWSFFGHENHILRWKMQRLCNLVVIIDWTQYHWKVLIFSQVMDQNGPRKTIILYMGIRFWP